jgi:glutamine cyclotransferase
MRLRIAAVIVVVTAVSSRVGHVAEGQVRAPALSGAEIVATHPHAIDAFTQGLELRDGRLYESTGLHARSSLRIVDLATGAIEQRVEVPAKYYAEGMTILEGRVYQLTYRSGHCFVYDADTLAPITQHRYEGEGWGLTHHEGQLVMSDGTHVLRFFDPHTFDEVRRVFVHEGERAITNLNELEWVEGEIFANVWRSDRIARIDPATGRVSGWIDLAFLRESLALIEPEAVLNGIAWDETRRRLFVTGKLWPSLFEIRLVPLNDA